MFYECVSQISTRRPDSLLAFVQVDSDKVCPCLQADIAMALYWFTADYYEGQASNLYAIHCELSKIYTPGLLESSARVGERFAAQIVYEDLERKWAKVLS